jgi:hypothetical protein
VCNKGQLKSLGTIKKQNKQTKKKKEKKPADKAPNNFIHLSMQKQEEDNQHCYLSKFKHHDHIQSSCYRACVPLWCTLLDIYSNKNL